jgi:Lon-like ATP-dependent protease
LKIVQDLGEDAFPEEKAEDKQAVAASNTSEAENTNTVTSTEDGEEKSVTTEQRKPLVVPETVHVKITSENLKDYVGPPVYHRDRFYVTPPPPGVSTGLGYLGNGSGAVMPVEATVSDSRSSIQIYS